MVTIMLCVVTCSLAASQRENARLKQQVFDLRGPGAGNLNATEADAAVVCPELGEVLGSSQGRPSAVLDTCVAALAEGER